MAQSQPFKFQNIDKMMQFQYYLQMSKFAFVFDITY